VSVAQPGGFQPFGHLSVACLLPAFGKIGQAIVFLQKHESNWQISQGGVAANLPPRNL
jgi:hypothetical protein